MNINIRKESLEDRDVIYNLIKEAFKNAEHSDGDEQNLVTRLRKSPNYIPELSLVATEANEIIAHVMLTKLFIDDGKVKHESLALAPVSVKPEFQNKGVGSMLINEALRLSKQMNYKSVFVLGSEKYYPRFGFKESLEFGIKAPFEVPSENFMAIELEDKALENVSGNIIYAKEFFEQN